MTSDAPTTEERYIVATQASVLKVHQDRRSDIDSLIAAGFLKDSVGTMLYRLHCEIDTQRAEDARVQRERQRVQGVLKELRKEHQREQLAMAYGPTRASLLVKDIAELEKNDAEATLTEHMLMLEGLRSLPAVREAIGRWAVVQASKYPLRHLSRRAQDRLTPDAIRQLVERAGIGSDRQVVGMAGQVLRAHLDPSCKTCTGRMFTGGYGSPQIKCATCKGTGKAKEALGESQAQREFCLFLLGEMKHLLAEVERKMRELLRAR